MRKVTVIGAAGLVGHRLSTALVRDGFAVRCSVRNTDKARRLLPAACEIVVGDIADLAAMRDAVRSVEAVFVCVHTISPQPKAAPGDSFVETELRGLNHIVSACREKGVRRLLYITFLGAAADSGSLWSRGRWQAEQLLLNSGLDATIFRPGQIVGKGGHGFDMMMSQAKRRVALVLGSGRQRMQNIAVDDLVNYLIVAMDEPRTVGHVFDVGGDVLTGHGMIDTAARVLGRRPPRKVHLPCGLLMPFAGLIERAAKLPKGAFRDLMDAMEADLVGDTRPIRAIFPPAPLDFRQAVERALQP